MNKSHQNFRLLLLCICLSFLAICHLIGSWEYNKIKWSANLPELWNYLNRERNFTSTVSPSVPLYAVMGADSNPTYLFPLPITVKAWKRLGVNTIVCLVGEREDYEKNEASSYVIETLEKQEVKLIFLSTKMAPSHTVSQTCRIFVAGSPYLNVTDDSILITTDSDLWKFQLHVPSGNQKIFITNSQCCGLTKKPNSNERFRMYPMGTIAMSAVQWREIIGIEKNWLVNGDKLAQRLYEEFGENFIRLGRGKPAISDSWYADQILVSERIHRYLSGKNASQVLGELPHVTARIDRAGWPYNKNSQNVALANFQDAHILHPLYSKNNWESTLPVIKAILEQPEEMREIENYHAVFMEKFQKKTS